MVDLAVSAHGRRMIWPVNKDQSIFDVGTMESWISETVASPRFSPWLAGLFAASAALLAAIGIYGVISLFGVGVTDPTTFVVIPVLILMVAFLAIYLPARRATRVDPLKVLPQE